MFQLKPGTVALVIGAKTSAGRCNIGKSVELFQLCQPGEVFINPVNGFTTMLPKASPRALWLVTGEVVSASGQQGVAWVRAEHLMPLSPDRQPDDATTGESQFA
ncbi:hypothetical protein [Citrobacter rodentium]|jgi:hypothetical protein|uniref:Periplasmic protein n=2 Tax=Citrobacter rodentium TaxID=67825 RepID=D2TUH0_CITRI|nr:hypothetical protein [Citrobacter rodentium]KIQ53222.1 periplasmic protein [Citrobacter rodentium]QBY27865.1 hypothetical protein E2R62_02795 [Citrobacter rodentium]UHO30247.1 hypothetical protein K7R23_20025 [Citrobacter rodentium NBRC 105723 = DSM 16636]CBG88023.1 conserved hypothetical protein [Citrobacter rodentium ICC168]HAT8013842.1 hypothetical protein [Citrobacter rodentium NBRC 105723 = DSM 16636]